MRHAWRRFLPLALASLLGLVIHTQGAESMHTRALIQRLSHTFEAINKGETDASRRWRSMQRDSSFSLLHNPRWNKFLCYVLSQINQELIQDQTVQDALYDLPLFRDVKRQVECAATLYMVDDSHRKRVESFLYTLPAIQDYGLWPAVLERLAEIDDEEALERFYRRSIPLTKSREPHDLFAQYCASHSASEMAQIRESLPVFTDEAGNAVLEAASNNPYYCSDFVIGNIRLYRSMINQAKGQIENHSGTPVRESDEVSDEHTLIQQTKKAMMSHRHMSLNAIFKEFAESKRLSFDNVLQIASYLIHPPTPPKLMLSLFEAFDVRNRYGQKASSFFYVILDYFASLNNLSAYQQWYIEASLADYNIPIHRIPLWDLLLYENQVSEEQLSDANDRAYDPYLYELILAKSRCMTETPVIERSNCIVFKSFLGSLEPKGRPHLEKGNWRLAKISGMTLQQLSRYLLGSSHNLPSTAAILGQSVKSDEHFEPSILRLLSETIKDPMSMTLIELVKALGTMQIRPICTPVFNPRLLPESFLYSFIDPNYSTSTKFTLLRFLLIIMTEGNFDDLESHGFYEEGDLKAMFNSIIWSYCSSLQFFPGIMVENTDNADEADATMQPPSPKGTAMSEYNFEPKNSLSEPESNPSESSSYKNKKTRRVHFADNVKHPSEDDGEIIQVIQDQI